MSSHYGSMCALLLLGVVFASGSPFQFISEKLEQNHRSIAHVLKLTQSDIITKPIFNFVIQRMNTSCQRSDKVQLMNITLGVYMRIFSSILQHGHNQLHDNAETLLGQVPEPNRPAVETTLQKLQQMMERVKSHLSHLNQDREDMISKLNKIEVEDPVIQRKALAQFKEIYQAASLIDHQCGHAHSSSAQ